MAPGVIPVWKATAPGSVTSSHFAAFAASCASSGAARGTFDTDHFLPVVHHPDRERTYDNLLYSCRGCNAVKGKRELPDPLKVLVSSKVTVTADGAIHAAAPEEGVL